MREITLSDGKTYTIKPLTRKQMREMAHLGVSPRGFRPDADQFEEAFDAMLRTQVADLPSIDPLPYPDHEKLLVSLIKETWGSEEEEKNS